MYTPNNADALLHVHGRTDGIHEITWALKDKTKVITLTYHPYPMKVFPEGIVSPSGRHLLLETWNHLDSKVDIIMSPQVGPGDNEVEAKERERAKYEARGIAEILQKFMSPFYNEADDIVREAVARYKARQSGTEHETKGLAEKYWDHNTRWDGTPYSQDAKPISTKKALDKETIKGIKNALAAGLFDEAGVADLYKITIEQVRSVL